MDNMTIANSNKFDLHLRETYSGKNSGTEIYIVDDKDNEYSMYLDKDKKLEIIKFLLDTL